MLADPDSLGNLPQDAAESLFDPEFWRSRGELLEVRGGRGSAWFIASGARQWVLRHFRRGGWSARWSRDGYVWMGEDEVRAFAEWRLLDLLKRRGLPVPQPVAARYQRSGFRYRMAWHPRVESDAAHGWLRATMRELGRTLMRE